MKSNIENNSMEPSGEFAASIRDFRSAVTHVAERETAHPVTAAWLDPARKRVRAAHQRIALAWACAVLLCFATIPFSGHWRHVAVIQTVAPARTTAPSIESDTALLEQVDTDVSESVPSSLAPLAGPDSWNTTSTNNSSDSSLSQTESTNVTR
jgi:hypothetical protein